MAELRTLFPKIEPYRTGWLKVSEIHSLYYEEVGNPAGIPVVFLHGGPGAGIHPTHRRFFNPDQFRVILFNQRGAGKSKPSGELRQNDTWELVEDIERLRQSLEIKSWFVFGGSWGSTLALAYAQSYPGAVRGLVLRGIFLGRQRELNWEYVDGASRIFPEAWEKFAGYIPTEERNNLPAAYYRRLISPSLSNQMEAAIHWYDWEDAISRLLPRVAQRMEDNELLAFARIECHYMVNQLFFPEDDFLLKRMSLIAHLPVWIAQGRYDVICPVVTAYELSQALPKASLHILSDAGHAITEPAIVDCLMRGIESLAGQP